MYNSYMEMMDDMAADFAMDIENDTVDYENDSDSYDGYDDEECGFNPYMGTYDYDC